MRTSLIWSAISCHILWIRHIKCAPLQRHVKITILPFTVTNLRILSKSSFKNTHLGVSSPASVADTLQNKKKNKIDRTVPCRSFLWSRSKRGWYYLQVAIATSNPIPRAPLLFFRSTVKDSQTVFSMPLTRSDFKVFK